MEWLSRARNVRPPSARLRIASRAGREAAAAYSQPRTRRANQQSPTKTSAFEPAQRAPSLRSFSHPSHNHFYHLNCPIDSPRSTLLPLRLPPRPGPGVRAVVGSPVSDNQLSSLHSPNPPPQKKTGSALLGPDQLRTETHFPAFLVATMSSPLGSFHSVAATAAHSLPFNSGRWLFSGVSTPLASPPASAPTRHISSPRPQLMQPYDSYPTGAGHTHPGYSVPHSASATQLARQDGGRDPRQRERTPPGMLLSSECDHCGNRVSVEVPRWMTDAMDVGGRALHDSVRLAPLEGPNQFGSHQGEHQWREGIVTGAVGVAQAVKNSPVCGHRWCRE